MSHGRPLNRANSIPLSSLNNTPSHTTVEEMTFKLKLMTSMVQRLHTIIDTSPFLSALYHGLDDVTCNVEQYYTEYSAGKDDEQTLEKAYDILSEHLVALVETLGEMPGTKSFRCDEVLQTPDLDVWIPVAEGSVAVCETQRALRRIYCSLLKCVTTVQSLKPRPTITHCKTVPPAARPRAATNLDMSFEKVFGHSAAGTPVQNPDSVEEEHRERFDSVIPIDLDHKMHNLSLQPEHTPEQPREETSSDETQQFPQYVDMEQPMRDYFEGWELR
ncbi:hypothetical protein EJ08DRAFT_700656 [Tothia fuscella]|uniref:Uncharacterized protein n=1 Tax=Tothia fuscella TaxID=1048955 RepID=A0A9P4TVE8_9PEZI|nr:hypothetical protein EJ08DRAFT_700656 [Tothia fuscella]